MAKIVRLPGSYSKRRRLDVRCQVSSRWLQFPEKASKSDLGSYMLVDLMTLSADEEPKKICELVLFKEDLEAMLSATPVKPMGDGN
jgi:hypothetical protein